MQICSHTATHPHLNSLSHSQIDTQVEAVETALYKIIGAVPSCIRPPFGEANADVVSYLNNKCVRTVYSSCFAPDLLELVTDQTLPCFLFSQTWPGCR